MQYLKKILLIWQNVDFIILLMLIVLGGFGVIMVYSATNGDMGYTERKILQVVLGLGICVGISNVKYTAIESLALPLLLFSVALLVFTLLFGVTSKGATRWISLGFTRFQPSEFAKITVPLFLCIYFGSKEKNMSFTNMVVSGVALLVPTILVAKQPDLGTGILILTSGIIVIFLAGLPWKYILTAIFGTISALPIVWKYGLHPYQKERIYTLLNPSADPLGSGYHVNQSKIAIGSGGILGKGLLLGTQVQLNFLPESHTDFIFSVLGEELGLVGVTILFVLYLILIFRLFYLASIAKNHTARLLCASTGFVFTIYIVVNVGMVSGILPVVGVPLPLISYGGTSLISLCITFGLVMGYYRQTLRQTEVFRNNA